MIATLHYSFQESVEYEILALEKEMIKGNPRLNLLLKGENNEENCWYSFYSVIKVNIR